MGLRALWYRMRGSLRRDAREQEVEREMRFHLDMATQRNTERGMTPDAALRQAKMTYGSVDATREAAREAYRARVAENVVTDVRYAVRSLRRSPAFALAAIVTVALGIGASTAIFSVVDAVLLRPLAIPRPNDFAYVGWVWNKGGEIPALSSIQYEFVREHHASFEAVATYRTESARIGDEASVPVRGLGVSEGFFGTMGTAPSLGRGFDARELQAGGPPVVMLGDATWRLRFAADSTIVGREIRLDGAARTVVGVMPKEFRFPPALDNDGYLVPFVPIANAGDEGHNTEAIVRLRAGTTATQRDAGLRALSDGFREAYPRLAAPGEGFKLFTHRDIHAAGIRRTIWILFGAVSLLLMSACANTATLMLVRASVRQREIAVRAALGAGPGRIMQQLLTEALVLSTIATTIGVLLGVVALRVFRAVAPTVLPPGMNPQVDGRVLTYAIAIAVVTAIAFGLATGVPSLRQRLQSAILGGARGATRRGTRTREVLVFVETSAAVVLLAGATLLVASFARLVNVDPGFNADRVLALRLGPMPLEVQAAQRDQLVDRLLARIREIPGVESAAAAPSLPLERGMNFPVDTRERPDLAIGATELRFVTPSYFATLGVQLVAGRDFGPGDTEGSEPVAIVNRTFAKRMWGEDSPIGRTIQIGHFNDRWVAKGLERQTRVIGVAADIHEIGLDRPVRPTVLVPRAQSKEGTPVLLVRGSSSALAAFLRDAVTTQDSRLTPTVEPLSSVLYRSVAGPRFRTMLFATFALSALLVAGIGIYGVIASVVQQRTREIGIRLALGAGRGTVAMTVVRSSLVSVGVGTVVGLAAFWALRRLLASMLYATSQSDPRLIAMAVGILAVVAVFAAWFPTRRAVRVDPATTLRLE